MTAKHTLFYVGLLLIAQVGFAQENSTIISGKIQEKDQQGQLKPLIGASVYWSGTTLGTSTDVNGEFSLGRTE